jgi:enoyl-CoA hydratase
MNELTTYDLNQGVATIVMDDGKSNTMSIAMLDELHKAFDQASKDKAVVILTGRESVFSSGFDLNVFGQGAENLLKMMTLGAELSEKVLSFPMPVITACNGHALPMGAFLMLSADRRICTEGDYKIGLNEVAIGLTVPYFAIEIARQRLTPSEFNRSVITSYMYTPREAVAAGFSDQLVSHGDLMETAIEISGELLKLDMDAHKATKLRVREDALKRIRSAIERELVLENVKAALGES